MKWIAFVILDIRPAKLQWPEDDELAFPSIDISVKDKPEANANIALKMSAKPGTINKMIGVASDVTVNMPNCTTIAFETEWLCRLAVETLQKQNGVLSVSCLQIETME